MADSPEIEFCILNVAANPHPEGTYIQLLRTAAKHPVNYVGDNYATITSPRKREEGYYQGRLVCWTEIDLTEPAIDKAELAERSLADLNLNIPENIGFNGRVFIYTLREHDHKIFVEVKNEFGKRLSPRMVGSIFQELVSADVQGLEAPYTEVTVIPDEDALELILGIPNLKRLKIHMVRPNADDITSDVEKVLAEMAAMGAKSQDVVLVAAPKMDLEPNERVLAQAEAGEMNGYVQGSGVDDDNNKLSYNTKEHPRIIKSIAPGDRSLIADALAVAKQTSVRQRRRKNP